MESRFFSIHFEAWEVAILDATLLKVNSRLRLKHMDVQMRPLRQNVAFLGFVPLLSSCESHVVRPFHFLPWNQKAILQKKILAPIALNELSPLFS